jgi:hypothetical protein
MRAINEACFRDEETATDSNRRRVTFAAPTATPASPTAVAAHSSVNTGVGGEERKESGSARSALRQPEVAAAVHLAAALAATEAGLAVSDSSAADDASQTPNSKAADSALGLGVEQQLTITVQ